MGNHMANNASENEYSVLSIPHCIYSGVPCLLPQLSQVCISALLRACIRYRSKMLSCAHLASKVLLIDVHRIVGLHKVLNDSPKSSHALDVLLILLNL